MNHSPKDAPLLRHIFDFVCAFYQGGVVGVGFLVYEVSGWTEVKQLHCADSSNL